MQSKGFGLIRVLGIFCWNYILYFIFFFLSLPFATSGFYTTAYLYFVTGALSYFWTPRFPLTTIPSGLAFPVALGTFASAIIADDTQGKANLSFWGSIQLMNREDIESLILAAIAATIGWLIMSLLLRKRKEWTRKARPYFFSLSACIVLVFLIISLIHS